MTSFLNFFGRNAGILAVFRQKNYGELTNLPKEYKPSENEPFMNPLQREYFRLKLVRWKEDLLKESKETLCHLQKESWAEPDISDKASFEETFAVELKTRDRERKLISKINDALQRLQKGDYGYCKETGEPIGVRRLEAWDTDTDLQRS